ncbi:MAG: FAD-binding protein, partial [Acidobacteriota bacterium]
IDEGGRSLTARRETDDGFETLRCPLPALISATEDLIAERFLRRDERELGKDKPIEVLTAADLADDPSVFGATGSPTWVDAIETVDVKRQQRILEGTLDEQIDTLVEVLLERGLFGTWVEGDASDDTDATPIATADGKAVWVVAETLGGELRPVTAELLGKARELARRHAGEVAVVLAGHRVEEHAATLAAQGADTVYLADAPLLADYSTEVYTAVLSRAIEAYQPTIVLLGSTAAGRDLAPRVAARLGLGLTGDCIDLAIDDEGRLVQYKPAFGGNIVAPIYSRTTPEMATVRPGLLDPAPASPGREPRIVRLSMDDLPASPIEILSRTGGDAAGAAALDSAEIAVGVGRGIGSAENLAVIRELAGALGDAPLATTRTVADRGWLPRQFQVGLTGRAIAPRLYFAIALRGALEHTVGIRRAGFVVAINDRHRSPIFKQADIGIVGDYAEIVPRLTAALKAAKASRA